MTGGGDEADGFKARKETKQAWKRSVEYFEQRGFNFDDKNPFEEAKKDLNPDHLLTDYQTAQDDIQKLRDQLKAILSDALNGSRP